MKRSNRNMPLLTKPTRPGWSAWLNASCCCRICLANGSRWFQTSLTSRRRRQLSPTVPISVLIGSFLHPPNVDAVLYFAKEIYPLIAQHLPTAKFYIIGDKAPPEVVALASKNVIVTGAVPDVRPFSESVKLSVAPLRFGAGVKGKISQSMAFRSTVVATSIAVEGMSLTHEEDVLVAEAPADFARNLVALYQSEEMWNRLSENGLTKARSLYSPQVALASDCLGFSATTYLKSLHRPRWPSPDDSSRY